jgi:hypothetical protein
LTNDRAKAAGIVYLEDESYKLQIKKGGREWSVYGSPVRFFFFVLKRVTMIKLTYGALFLKSGSHISVAGRSITGLGRRLKVDTSLISSVY